MDCNRLFAVVADSTCDLDKDLRDRYGIDYVPMNYILQDREYPASLDWEYHSAREFYDLMRRGEMIRTTQVPRQVYLDRFARYLAQGLDVLYISCSSALSGSINTANLVGRELEAQFPGRRVRCVDSLISSLGQGALCMEACRLADLGQDVQAAADHITAIRLTANQVATVENLEYLRRVGRVTASSAFFGNLFGVKPILISDALGRNFALKKIKGALNARRELAAMTARLAVRPEEQTLYISHADSEAAAIQLRDLILQQAPFRDCRLGCIGPIVGASVGPGTLAVYFFGQTVTTNAEEAGQ